MNVFSCSSSVYLLNVSTSSYSKRVVSHSHGRQLSFPFFHHVERYFSISPKNIQSNKNHDTAIKMIRLSKRMSELDLCSRREADEYITQNRVFIQGRRVPPILGQKVNKNEMNIRIDYNMDRNQPRNESKENHNDETTSSGDWNRRRGDTIVLHKPIGYVSGQPEKDHGHIPAVRLLTRANLYIPSKDTNEEIQQTLSLGKYLHFHARSTTTTTASSSSSSSISSTLKGYVPAGRLDLDSSGLLIFTKCGVMAKKLTMMTTISSSTSKKNKQYRKSIEKEYRVWVEPVQSITRYERESLQLRGIPHPTTDLSLFLKGGTRLWNDPKPLKPLLVAEWLSQKDIVDEETSTIHCHRSNHNNNNTSIDDKHHSSTSTSIRGHWKGILRLVLQEGKKHQIRRMCREILGLHVTKLVRVRIGNIHLEDLPEGKWRPLRETEYHMLLNSTVMK